MPSPRRDLNEVVDLLERIALLLKKRGGISPRALDLDQATTYVRLSKKDFNREIALGNIPRPRAVHRIENAWDIRDLDEFLDVKFGKKKYTRSGKDWVDLLDDDHADQGH